MLPVIIIGSGMAGYTVAREFRKLDKSTPVVIMSNDDGAFYAKPMLSNAFAMGKLATQIASQSAEQMAQQLDASVMQHTTVNQIDSFNKTVNTKEASFGYSKLVLAVGAQAIRLPIAGNAAEQVMSVNNLQDYIKLREVIAAKDGARRIVILGAGLIGCEFADDLASAGHHVSVVDPNLLPLAALAPQPISLGLKNALVQRGVQFKLGTTASNIDQHQDTKSLNVSLANHEIINADIIISAVGLRADLRLAQAANLETERGIIVDAAGQTSAQDIYAIGDCAQYTHPANGQRQMLPYIAPIMVAARAIARNLQGDQANIDFKPMPIIVKTPSYPIALLPPAPQLAALGHWQHELDAEMNISRFYDGENRMTGFAVAPQQVKIRTALLAEIIG